MLTTATTGFVLAAASLIGSWSYRRTLRRLAGTLGDDTFVWSLAQDQAADMLLGAVENIKVVLGIRQPAFVPASSNLNNYASNRIYMWWYSLPHAGVPRLLVLAAAGSLVLGLIFSTRRLASREAAR